MKEAIAPSRLLWFTRKRLFQIHGWLGMTFGALLLVICFSGAAAALSHEIDWMLNPTIRSWPQGDPLPWGVWMKSATIAQPDWKPRWIAAPLNRYFAAEIIAEAPSGQLRRIYVNPYTGTVQGTSSYFNVQRFLRDFHRLLNLPTYGLYIVSSFGFTLLFSVVSGLLFYKNWRQNLFRLRLHKGPKALWSDVHRLVGTWSFVFAAMIGVTGIWYFVEQTLTATKWTPREVAIKLTDSKLAGHGYKPRPLDVDELVQIGHRAFPDLDMRTIWFPITSNDPIRIDGQTSALLVRDRANQIFLDPYDGEVLKVQRAENLSMYQRWEDTADPLHFGDFGGLLTKIIWSALGMALPIMILTGAYLSIRHSRSTSISSSWWRVRQWSTATWLGILVFGIALSFSISAMTRYRTPRIPDYVPQGHTSIGPWAVFVAVGKGSVRVEIPCPGCTANFSSISLSTSDAGKSIAMKQHGVYWVANNLTVPTGQLRITINDWNGATHAGSLSVPKSAFENPALHVPDEGPYTGIGTWFFLAPFLFVLIAAFVGWVARFGNWESGESLLKKELI